MWGLNVSAYLAWAAANVAGALLGGAFGDSRRLGFDFALTAMFAALLVLQMKAAPARLRAIVVAAVAAALAIALSQVLARHVVRDRGDARRGNARLHARTAGRAMMTVRPEILLIILGGALVTVLPRVLPLVVLSRLDLPEALKSWLAYVPIAILAALLAGELALEQGAIVLKWRDLVAVVPVLAVVAVSRSIIGAVVAGVVVIALLRSIA